MNKGQMIGESAKQTLLLLAEKLQKENKELKEANDTFTLGAKRTIESNCKLYKENQELKEEIKELQEKLEATSNTEGFALDGMKLLHTENKKLKEENEKLKNVICNPIIHLNKNINCSGKEKYLQYCIKQYEETIWKIENKATGMGDY